jgi:RNA polymerase primary sigma factor
MSIDPMADYLDMISRHPLLTGAEEIECGHRIQRWQELINTKDPTNPTAKEKRIIRAGKRARDRLIQGNLRLVIMVAKRYMRRVTHLEMLDLIQEGNIGLARACLSFDPTRGYKFSTYSYWWIRQQITRQIQKAETLIKKPGQLADLETKISVSAIPKLMETNKAITSKNIAEVLNQPVAEVELVLDRRRAIASLDESREHTDGRGPMHDFIPCPKSLDDDPDFYEYENERMLIALNALTEEERMLVERKWGVNGRPECSYAEISRDTGISRERVRQKENKARAKIRGHLRRNDVRNTDTAPKSEHIPCVIPKRHKVGLFSLTEQKRQNLQFRNSEHRFL